MSHSQMIRHQNFCLFSVLICKNTDFRFFLDFVFTRPTLFVVIFKLYTLIPSFFPSRDVAVLGKFQIKLN